MKGQSLQPVKVRPHEVSVTSGRRPVQTRGRLRSSRTAPETGDSYNREHRHRGLGFLTPAVVQCGVAASVREQRQHVLAAVYAAHPERFMKGLPHPVDLPQAVWINPPAKKSTAQDAPGSTIVISDDLRVDSRRGRSLGHHADRPRRDSNCCALGVSMSLTSSEVCSWIKVFVLLPDNWRSAV